MHFQCLWTMWLAWDHLGWTLLSKWPSDQLAPVTLGNLTHLPGHVTVLVTPSSVSLRTALVHLLLVVQLAIRSWLLPWETPERGKQHLPKVEVTEPRATTEPGPEGWKA